MTEVYNAYATCGATVANPGGGRRRARGNAARRARVPDHEEEPRSSSVASGGQPMRINNDVDPLVPWWVDIPTEEVHWLFHIPNSGGASSSASSSGDAMRG